MRRSRILALTASLLVLTGASPAFACVNEYIRVYVLPVAVRAADRAERALADGDARRAARDAVVLYEAVQGTAYRSVEVFEPLVGDMYADTNIGDGSETDVGRLADEADSAPLQEKAALLYAISVARIDGQVTRQGRVARRVAPAVRQEALDKALAAITPDAGNPREDAYYAEVLSVADPSRAAEARATLEDLARRDLIVDPFSYLALARMTTDEARRAEWVARCAATASTRGARACRLQ